MYIYKKFTVALLIILLRRKVFRYKSLWENPTTRFRNNSNNNQAYR